MKSLSVQQLIELSYIVFDFTEVADHYYVRDDLIIQIQLNPNRDDDEFITHTEIVPTIDGVVISMGNANGLVKQFHDMDEKINMRVFKEIE